LPEARILPSGLKATDVTGKLCPLRVAVIFPLFTSHSLIVLSSLPQASAWPSGLNATEEAGAPCPLRVASSLPVATPQTSIVMPLEGGGVLGRLHVPQLNGLVRTPRGQHLAVRAESHG